MYSIKQEIKRLNETGLRYETKLKATNISSKKACKLNAAVLKLHGKVRDKASQYRHTNSAKNNILAVCFMGYPFEFADRMTESSIHLCSRPAIRDLRANSA
jgi:hypothetical protein